MSAGVDAWKNTDPEWAPSKGEHFKRVTPWMATMLRMNLHPSIVVLENGETDLQIIKKRFGLNAWAAFNFHLSKSAFQAR